VQDASGASRVFEYIDGALKVYDNTEVGVLTNDPSYEWQLGHLNLYGDYPSSNAPRAFQFTVDSKGPFTTGSVPIHSGGGTGEASTVVPDAGISHGFNTRGLPAGYTPPDRFVKMFLLKQVAVSHAPPADLNAGVAVITGLLNTVHIVRGTVAGGWPLPYEYTNWACIKVPWAKSSNSSDGGEGGGGSGGPLFYYRTYENMQWKRIEVDKIDFSGAHNYPPIELYEPGLGVKDVTPSKQDASLRKGR